MVKKKKYGSNEYLIRETEKPVPASKSQDLTSKVTGDFGKWQLRIGVMMALLKLPVAWYQLNIIFLAPPQEFWCHKPPQLSKLSEEEWREISQPKVEEHPCLIYDPDILKNFPSMDRTLIPLVKCTMFTYDRSVFNRTIVSDWDLVCSKHWLVHLSQSILMWGILVGGLLFGGLADKYGRKMPLMWGIIIQGVCGFISGLMPWFWGFMVNRFIMAMASGGIGIISFVICMEVVSGKWRTIIPVLSQLPFSLGNTIMAVLAYFLRDWRKFEFALAFLSCLYILYWFCIPESPRWLIAKGKTEEALEVLKAAAKTNNRKFEIDDVRKLMPHSQSGPANNPDFKAFLKLKGMRLKTILLSINWFCTGLSFYTFSQYLGSIGDNIFVTVALSGLISTPGAIICVFVITRVGRRTTVAGFQLLTAFCFVFILLIPRNVYANDWPRILCAGIGLGGMAGSVPALYLFSGELYPTLGRNVGIGAVTTFARIGSMIAPFLASLDTIVPNLPLIFLAAMSFAQIVLLVPLPETKDWPLPDTIEQAESFTKEYQSREQKATTVLFSRVFASDETQTFD